MIAQIYRHSLLHKIVFSARKYYQFSLLAALFSSVSRSFAQSETKKVLIRLLGAPVSFVGGAFWRALNRFNMTANDLGLRLTPTVRSSLLVRGWRGFADSSAVHSSRLYACIFKYGLKRIVIFLFVMYLPMDFAIRSVSSLSFIASIWDDAFLLAALIYVVLRMMSAKKAPSPRVSPVDGVVLLFIGVGFALMCINAPNFSIAIAGYRAVAQYLIWFFVLIRLIEDDGDLMVFYGAFVAMGTAIALHGIYQYIIAVPIPAGWVSATEVGVRTRVFSILGSPNIMGCVMVMIAPMAAGLAYRFKSVWLKMLMWCAVGVMVLACLFTFSRGAWLGMAAAVLVFGILRDRKLLVLMAVAAGIAVFIPEISNRITYLFTSDFAEASARGGRAGRWATGLDLLVKGNPWIGFGLGRFGGAVAMQNQVIEGLDYFYMDNYYLKTLVEMGYLGFASYLVLILTAAYNGLRSLFRSRFEKTFDLAVGIFAGLVGVLVHCLFENIFEVPYMNAYFWGLAAALIWMGFLRKNKYAPTERAK